MLKRKGDEFRCITPSEVDIQVAVGCYDGSQHPFQPFLVSLPVTLEATKLEVTSTTCTLDVSFRLGSTREL